MYKYYIIIGHQCSKPELKELCRYSERLLDCWRELALELGLPFETIKTLDIDCTRIQDKCRQMFDMWLERSSDPCWHEIVEALRMIRMSRLANSIEAEHLGM